jgi:hypothetical protein
LYFVFSHLDLDRPAIGHRIACIDREIENRQLQLIGVDPGRRQSFRQIKPQRDAWSQRALQQIAHALDQPAQIDRHHAQILLASERQQALGQRSASLCALQRAIDQPMQARIVRQALAQQVEITHHRHQQIVEVVRNTAGQLSNGLHFLCLPQLLLRLFAGGDFLHQVGRALFDALLEGRGQFRQRGALGSQLLQQILTFNFRGLTRRDVGANSDQGFEAAIKTTHRARTYLHPMLRTIRPDHTVFDAVVAARLDGLFQGRGPSRPIVGMHGFQQVLVGKGFAGAPPEIGLAGIGSLQLVVGQMQFQRTKMTGAQRGLQQAFAFGKVLQNCTALILATPASDGRADDAHQRGRMKRAFEECDIAKQLPEPGCIRISLGTPALMCQQHDWKIRPGRLTTQPGDQPAQIRRLDRLVGDNG